jgi:drug/metabolite transporter (DMT)-like permease
MTVADAAAQGVLHRANIRGILAMMASMFALTLNFAFVKMAGGSLPVGEVLFLRGLIAATIIAAATFVIGAHRRFGEVIHRTVVWRTVCECGAAVLFVTALVQTPIADATVILQVMPLMITAGAALWLGERVHWRRWAAIVSGLIGVAIVIRPGLATFQWASLLVLGSVFLSSLRDLSTRRMPPGIPTVLVALVASSTLSLLGLSFAVFENWVVPDAQAFLQVGGSGLLLSAGLFTVVLAMRGGELSIIAPFRYSAVLWAVVFGYLFWGETPDLPTVAGALIVVGSGAYVSYRERAIRATVPAMQTDAAAEVIPTDREDR